MTISWVALTMLIVCLSSGFYAIGRQSGYDKGFKDARFIYRRNK